MKPLFFKKSHFAGLTLAIVGALAISMVAQAAAGGLDPSFGSNGKVVTYAANSNNSANAIAIQSDGKIVVAGKPLLARYNSNGTMDTTFGTNGIVNISGIDHGMDVVIQPDGKILVAGQAEPAYNTFTFVVARLNRNGSVDTTFGTNGIASRPPCSHDANVCFAYIHSIALQSDGKILVAGNVDISDMHTEFNVVRYNSDGSFDQSETPFFSGNYHYLTALAVQRDGKIILAGNYFDGNPPGYRLAFVRLNPDLTFDSTFGGNGVLVTDFGSNAMFDSSIALQSDGKIVAVGEYGCSISDYYCTANGYKFGLARFNTNGAVDTAFGTNGVITSDFNDMADVPYSPNTELKNITIQSDGKLIVGTNTFDGSHYHFLLARFNSSGSLDTTFGLAGKMITAFGNYDDNLHAIVLQPDGKVLAAGSSSNGTNTGIALARYIAGTITPVSTTFISQAANDGWILESSENSNVGGTQNGVATTFNVGDDPSNKQYRSILSFNTVTLPDTAIVTAAQLKIRIQGVVGTDPFSTHGNLLVDIRNGRFGNSIGLELVDFASAASAGTAQEHISPITYNWYGVSLSATNLGYISKVGVSQFRLRFSLDDDNDRAADYIKYYSGNAPAGYQPQLIVTYYVP